jgi:hypothetical protein
VAIQVMSPYESRSRRVMMKESPGLWSCSTRKLLPHICIVSGPRFELSLILLEPDHSKLVNHAHCIIYTA